jgi:hypothetical protein
LVAKYAKDMVNGDWTPCPEPITFYADGALADGQHRLWAIVESNTTQTMPVARNLPRPAGLNLNNGLGRSVIDNAFFAIGEKKLTHELIAVCRAVEDGNYANYVNQHRKNGRSNAQILAMVDKHREAAVWAVVHGPKGKKFRNAVVLGAMARAWYVEADKDRLARFGQIVTDGFAQGDVDSAAVALRNLLMMGTSLTQGPAWRDTFLKAQNAVHHFMRFNKLTVLRAPIEEPYSQNVAAPVRPVQTKPINRKPPPARPAAPIPA